MRVGWVVGSGKWIVDSGLRKVSVDDMPLSKNQR